jgi:hypothetical protein
MKLLNLKSLNKLIRKHIFTVLIGLLSIVKKDSSMILILSIIVSLFGSNLLKNFCGDNIPETNSQNSSHGTNESDKKWASVLKNKLGDPFKAKDNKSFPNNEVDVEDVDEDDEIDENKSESLKLIKNSTDNMNNELIKKNIETDIKKKKNVKVINKLVDKFNNHTWYKNSKDKLLQNYYSDEPTHDYALKVTDENKHLLICNLRTYSNIDFYFKLHITDYNSKKLNQLIMLRDIQNWMCNSTITNEEFGNVAIPVYLIFKDHKSNSEIMIFEIYKMFFYEKEEGRKQCFVSKGEHYVAVEEILDILFRFNYVQNLCNGKDYDTYDLGNSEELCNFLDKLLSGCTLQNNNKDDKVYLDMNQKTDNIDTFEYFYEVLNGEQMIKGIDSMDENNEKPDTIIKKEVVKEKEIMKDTIPDVKEKEIKKEIKDEPKNNKNITITKEKLYSHEKISEADKHIKDEFKEDLDSLLLESVKAKSTPKWIQMLTTI